MAIGPLVHNQSINQSKLRRNKKYINIYTYMNMYTYTGTYIYIFTYTFTCTYTDTYIYLQSAKDR
jgi:hypothetical protein